MSSQRGKLALVLGSGGARGWAHLGVLRRLRELDLVPDMVVGSSIGSLVGAAWAAGQTEALEQLATALDWKRALYYFLEFNVPRAGLIDGQRIERLMRELLGSQEITALPRAYRAVATDLEQGVEFVFSKGDLIRAIRASISIPGIFTPVAESGRTLVDGGLVNPLPVSVARAWGAKRVIAVEINLKSAASVPRSPQSRDIPPNSRHRLLRQLQERLMSTNWPLPASLQHWLAGDPLPNIFEVLVKTVRILENQVTRHRLETEPPDLLIQPLVGHLATLDFHTAPESIAAGYEAAQAETTALRSLT